jgi:hypothetical protein
LLHHGALLAVAAMLGTPAIALARTKIRLGYLHVVALVYPQWAVLGGRTARMDYGAGNREILSRVGLFRYAALSIGGRIGAIPQRLHHFWTRQAGYRQEPAPFPR